MQDLKKIGAVGGAVALLACWPLAVGQIGQNVFRDGVAKLDSQSIGAEIVDYQRGYLSSQVITKYQVKDPVLIQQLTADGVPTEITVEHKLNHGLFGIDTVSKLTEEDIPVVLTSHTQLNGNTDFVLDVENLNFQAPDGSGSSVSFAHSTVSGSVTVLGEMDVKFNFPSIHVSFDTGEVLSFTNLTGYGNGKKVNGFWDGEQKVSLAEFSMEVAGGTQIMNAKDLSYRFLSSKNETGDRIQTNHLMKAGMFSSADGVVDDLNIDFTLGELDRDAFEHLVTLYSNNAEITSEVAAQYQQHIDNLFDKGFELSMNQMSLSLGEGLFDSKWLLVVPPGIQNASQDITKVVPELTGKLDTFISEGLVTEYPFIRQGIDELVVMEMVTPVDDGYQIDAKVEEGNLVFVSGQKLPLVSLLMPLLMQ